MEEMRLINSGDVFSHSSNDLQFLCKLTSLSEAKLLTLLENDFDLLIDELSGLPVYDGDFGSSVISFPLFTKLTIFRKTKNSNFKLNEKVYVADSISIYYPKLYKSSYLISDNCSIKESKLRFYLVLMGMFPEYIENKTNRYAAPSLEFYTNLLKNGLNRCNKAELSNHVDYWINTLHDIKMNYWH